jgi:hypothetical protein
MTECGIQGEVSPREEQLPTLYCGWEFLFLRFLTRSHGDTERPTRRIKKLMHVWRFYNMDGWEGPP